MNAMRTILSTLLLSAPIAVGCTPGGNQGMQMGANQPPQPTSQPDLRDPSERDPGLHVTTPPSAPTSPAGEPSPASDEGDDDMAAQMKELGARMKDMGEKMQNKARTMKSAKAPAAAAGSVPGAVDHSKMKELGAQMKQMGQKMQSKGHAMKMAAAPQKPPPADSTAGMDPDKMMQMGKEMMEMAGPMMEMSDADPDKMMQMGQHMAEMAGPMMGMGGGMGPMGHGMEGKKKAPMKKPAATPPPSDGKMPMPMPPSDPPPSDPPMQHM